MGLDYSYEIIASREAAARLVESLAAHLVSSDAERLLTASRESAEGLMANVRREQYEARDLCLSFLFGSDERIAEHGGIDGMSDPATNRVAIGCVWSKFRCGDRFVLFSATAATSAMSRLFESSPSIRAAFTQIGREAGALLVAFDDEQGALVGVWPCTQRMGACVLDEMVRDADFELLVDPYCTAVLQAFGIAPGGQMDGI